ncbi:MAG: class II aldolase/adducin family protein, partial [Candidatus Omnitrophica bacterium]|nr:class II aldolase/adducin family protein [Candidatus Omnitrophota bacterium]
MKILKEEMIKVGRRLYDAGLAVANSGNISARLNDEDILITATGTHLGSLKDSDIVVVNLFGANDFADKKPSSELPLHSLIYKNFSVKTVI